jgi:hypothetical protein
MESHQGAKKATSRKATMRRFIIVGGLLVVFLIGVVALVVWENPHARVASVRAGFDQMPSVRVTSLSDLSRQASEIITAEIDVSGKGQMSFTGLSSSSFRRASRIRLSGIGPYGFRMRQLVGKQEAYGYDLDIGPSSPIPAARGLKITSVQSAVAHYDDLLALVAGWPVTTNERPRHWPPRAGEWSVTTGEEVHFQDLPRGDYYFCLRRSHRAHSEHRGPTE